MQFLTSLFGGSQNTILTAAMALGIVLVLIVLGLWLLKLLSKATANAGRGRVRRLGVIDNLAIDPKRQLIIIRRDNVEHLILTGGPQDLLIEAGIPVEQPMMRPPVRRPAAAPPAPAAATPMPTPAITPPVRVQDGPAAQPLVQTQRTSLEQLREFRRPVPEQKPGSLRHTGLMRPVSRMEPTVLPANTDNMGQGGADSARSRRDAEAAAPDGKTNGQSESGSFSGNPRGWTNDGN